MQPRPLPHSAFSMLLEYHVKSIRITYSPSKQHSK
jgi:hypothetical protein